MKIAAHPLVVAAALGLLGPAALVEDDKSTKTDPCAQCDCGAAAIADCMPEEAAFTDLDDGPSAQDFARVEAEWHAAVLALPEDLVVS